jgi:hypothetical protein
MSTGTQEDTDLETLDGGIESGIRLPATTIPVAWQRRKPITGERVSEYVQR